MSATNANEVRSFQIEIPDEQIDDLRRRIAATRWPTKELVEVSGWRSGAGGILPARPVSRTSWLSSSIASAVAAGAPG